MEFREKNDELIANFPEITDEVPNIVLQYNILIPDFPPNTNRFFKNL